MVKIFAQTDKTFTSNGDVVIKPLKAVVHKQDNADYYLDLECGLQYSGWMVEGNIIVADTPQGEQPFRITNPQKDKSKITVKAWHVFFDSKNYLIADSYVVDKNCNDALIHLNSATEPQSEFTVGSNIATVDSYRCTRESLYTAFMTVLERWGGHLVRDKFNVQILSAIGQDRGITIQYKKNLKEITVSENWDNVVTKILPVGKDGILLNGVNPSESIYIVSSTQYSIPYTKTVSFEQDIEQEEGQSEEAYHTLLVNDLRSQATSYLAQNCVPQVNYTLNAHIDRIIDIGDTIRVNDERLGINLMTDVISYDWDCLTQRYTQVEFGNFRKTLSGLLPSIRNNISNTVNMAVSGKQNTLVSGLNIKTVNSQSLLGDGNLVVGGSVDNITNSDIDRIISS